MSRKLRPCQWESGSSEPGQDSLPLQTTATPPADLLGRPLLQDSTKPSSMATLARTWSPSVAVGSTTSPSSSARSTPSLWGAGRGGAPSIRTLHPLARTHLLVHVSASAAAHFFVFPPLPPSAILPNPRPTSQPSAAAFPRIVDTMCVLCVSPWLGWAGGLACGVTRGGWHAPSMHEGASDCHLDVHARVPRLGIIRMHRMSARDAPQFVLLSTVHVLWACDPVSVVYETVV